jgi:hypothetical protein
VDRVHFSHGCSFKRILDVEARYMYGTCIYRYL